MNDVRWCFTHGTYKMNWKIERCIYAVKGVACDVRDGVVADPETQVVLPKGDYYEYVDCGLHVGEDAGTTCLVPVLRKVSSDE